MTFLCHFETSFEIFIHFRLEAFCFETLCALNKIAILFHWRKDIFVTYIEKKKNDDIHLKVFLLILD